jgi:uncharacterized membrane protein
MICKVSVIKHVCSNRTGQTLEKSYYLMEKLIVKLDKHLFSIIFTIPMCQKIVQTTNNITDYKTVHKNNKKYYFLLFI